MVPKIIISVVCRESIVRAVGHAKLIVKILSASVTFDYHLSSVGVIYNSLFFLLLFFATRPCYCGLLGREGTAHVSALLSIIDIPRLVVLFAAKDIITTYRIDNQFSHVRPPMLSPIE